MTRRALAEASLLLDLATKIGPCPGWDLDLSGLGEPISVWIQADSMVTPDLLAMFARPNADYSQKVELQVRAREPGHRLALIKGFYLHIGRLKFDIDVAIEGSLSRAVKEICARDGMPWLPAQLDPSSLCLASGAIYGRVLTQPGCVFSVADPGDIDRDLFHPSDNERGEMALNALVRAAIAIPEPLRHGARTGLIDAMADLISQIRVSGSGF